MRTQMHASDPISEHIIHTSDIQDNCLPPKHPNTPEYMRLKGKMERKVHDPRDCKKRTRNPRTAHFKCDILNPSMRRDKTALSVAERSTLIRRHCLTQTHTLMAGLEARTRQRASIGARDGNGVVSLLARRSRNVFIDSWRRFETVLLN